MISRFVEATRRRFSQVAGLIKINTVVTESTIVECNGGQRQRLENVSSSLTWTNGVQRVIAKRAADGVLWPYLWWRSEYTITSFCVNEFGAALSNWTNIDTWYNSTRGWLQRSEFSSSVNIYSWKTAPKRERISGKTSTCADWLALGPNLVIVSQFTMERLYKRKAASKCTKDVKKL